MLQVWRRGTFCSAGVSLSKPQPVFYIRRSYNNDLLFLEGSDLGLALGIGNLEISIQFTGFYFGISRVEYLLEAFAYLDRLWVELLHKALKVNILPSRASGEIADFSRTFCLYLRADLTLEAVVSTTIL